MDELVRQAMIKWPNVPHCHGWLGLDARGQWYLRDERAQSAGAFESARPGARGEPIRHEALIAFIQRNYASDEAGQWYFQNGPQRVYVELERAPWVMRLWPEGAVRTHTGLEVCPTRCLVDEEGVAFLDTPDGLGVVHSLDMGLLADRLETGVWPVETVVGADLPIRHGFVLSPAGNRTRISG